MRNYVKRAKTVNAEPIFFSNKPPKCAEPPSDWAIWSPEGFDSRFRQIGESEKCYVARMNGETVKEKVI